MAENSSMPDLGTLRGWAQGLGFQLLGAIDVRSFDRSEALQAWLDRDFHGEMDYLAREPAKRSRPADLVPGTVSALIVSLDYAPDQPDWVAQGWQQISSPGSAYVSNYARGRDYHKLVRNRLQKLATRVTESIGPFGYRAFCDSAPVMEVALAEQAGLGWRGKHTLLLNRERGSMFFLGALFTDLPLEADGLNWQDTAPSTSAVMVPPGRSFSSPQMLVDLPAAADSDSAAGHCGSCRRCLDICPTQAIVAPYELDARRCISYLTIELKGPIPEALRPLIGNRVYGCDDCQLVCPWNKFAQPGDTDFAPRHGLDSASLIDLFGWTAEQFDERTRGSAIRRIGHERWLRNLAVGLGNLADIQVSVQADNATDQQDHATLYQRACQALELRVDHPSALVREHVLWALGRLR